MKNAFTLLELIIVVIIISLLASFIVSKSQSSIDISLKTKIKSEIALIRASISKQKTKRVLLKDELIKSLDEATINTNEVMLFSKILDFPLVSTTKDIKKIGNWVKTSTKDYVVYLSASENLNFSFENNAFVCKSDLNLCKEYE